MEHSDDYTLVTVASGARSLRSLRYKETFHPVVGPMEEAQRLHVAQSNLLQRAAAGTSPLVVWDVGLGAAANAIALLESWQGNPHPIELHSFDLTLEPLAFARQHAAELGYLERWSSVVEHLVAFGTAKIDAIEWTVHLGDFRRIVVGNTPPKPHAIFYDPYSPAANPGMWSLEHFSRLRNALDPERPCTLTSYSRSTAVRVTLALAGFAVGQGRSTGEKDETTVAATHRELLHSPLDRAWLERVSRSTRGAPLREGQEAGPISAEDLTALQRRLLSENVDQ